MAGNDPNNVAWSALRQALGGLQVNEPLLDKTPLGAGNFWVRVGVGISTGATNIPIELPRKPSGIIVVDNNTGAVVFRTASDVAQSGPSVYVCRATTFVSVTAIFL